MTALAAPVPAPVAAPIEVGVALADRSYTIAIGRGLVAGLGEKLGQLRPKARVAIVTDAQVASHHLAAVEASLQAAGIVSAAIVVPAGEPTKRWEVLGEVVEQLLAARIERGDLVLALGGGVIGDLAGFASAILRRGCDFVQVPTTLLAQVDSSVGGKTGVNARAGKNLIGAFHQPIHVCADLALLDTLPARELAAGYAEVVKYGLLGDAAFFDYLERHGAEVLARGPALAEAVAVSCRAKAAIVARDERETGDRALLNLGHTFGHAIEKVTGFSARCLHGEAVAIGMRMAFAFSAGMGLSPAEAVPRVEAHLRAAGLPTRLGDLGGGFAVGPLMDAIAQDKKVARGSLTFILVRGIGAAFVARDVAPATVEAFLAREVA